MFSAYALSQLNKRGRTFGAYVLFFRDSWSESVQNVRDNPRLVRSIIIFSLIVHLIVVAALAPLYLPRHPSEYLRFIAYAGAGMAGLTAWILMYVGALRGKDGTPFPSVGLPNYLTLLRFFLIIPVVSLLSHGFTVMAFVLYAVQGVSDVADGIVARSRGQQSQFGVVMDPLADVFSTAAVFAVFLGQGLIPLWLFLILMARYVMLILGSFVLFLVAGPIPYRATIPGKVVGVFQAVGAGAIMILVIKGGEWKEEIGRYLFPLLGINFASIVVSQLILGLRHVRRGEGANRKAVQVGS